jgi:uncharacterized protein
MIPRQRRYVKSRFATFCVIMPFMEKKYKIPLGVSDSPAVRALLKRGELVLDYLEVHGPYVEETRRVYPHQPMLLHNNLYFWSLAHPGGLAHQGAARLTVERLKLARSPWLSLHLGFSAAEIDFFDEAIQPLDPTLPAEIIFERTCRTLAELIRLVDVPVLVENMDYNPTGAYESICQADFIKRVLENTGAGLLLDLAHARVSAAAFGMPVEAYLKQLPLERVRQIHINHPGWRAGRRVDSHEALEEEDYLLLQDVLGRCSPWSLTLEYNRDEAGLLDQVEHLRSILEN